MENSFCKKHEATVKRVARQAAFRWNEVMEPDDIEQELWLFVMASPSVQRYLDQHSEGENSKALKRKADYICSQERLSYEFFSGNFHYSTQEVAWLFDTLACGDELEVEEKIDLGEAVDTLLEAYPQHYESVQKYFVAGERAESAAERKRKSRALEKLTTTMNLKRGQRENNRTEGPGTKPRIPKGGEGNE